MKKFSRGLWLAVAIAGFSVLVACGPKEIPEKLLNLDYLDELALEHPDEELTYSEIEGEYVHNFIKQNKDKSIRWTATVTRVENATIYELEEPLLPAILVTFEEELDPPAEVGDVLTFTGVLAGYGETFGKDPLWVVDPARLETTTDEEMEALRSYQESAMHAKEGDD